MYFEFFKKSFQQCVTYRANTLMRFFSSFIFLFVTVSIWTALYQGRESVDGVVFLEMLTYVLMVQIVSTVNMHGVIEYPGAFWATTIAKMLGWGANVAILYLTIYRFGNVMAWSAYEVMLLYSINIIAYAIAGFFMFHPFTKLSAHVRGGTFDEMLTKPLNPFFYLCCREFSTGYFSNLFVGIIGLVICFTNLVVHPDRSQSNNP